MLGPSKLRKYNSEFNSNIVKCYFIGVLTCSSKVILFSTQMSKDSETEFQEKVLLFQNAIFWSNACTLLCKIKIFVVKPCNCSFKLSITKSDLISQKKMHLQPLAEMDD